MIRPRQPSPRLTHVTGSIRALAVTTAAAFRHDKDDLFQVGYERAILLEPEFDAASRASFLTFIYRAVVGDMIRYATKNAPLATARNWTGLVDAAATQTESFTKNVDLLGDTEEQLGRLHTDLCAGITARMALHLAAQAAELGERERESGADVALQGAEQRQRLRRALDEEIAKLVPPDQELVRRHGLGGEELKRVLAEMPAWKDVDYVNASDRQLGDRARVSERREAPTQHALRRQHRGRPSSVRSARHRRRVSCSARPRTDVPRLGIRPPRTAPRCLRSRPRRHHAGSVQEDPRLTLCRATCPVGLPARHGAARAASRCRRSLTFQSRS